MNIFDDHSGSGKAKQPADHRQITGRSPADHRRCPASPGLISHPQPNACAPMDRCWRKRGRARRCGWVTGRGDRAHAVIAAHVIVVPHPMTPSAVNRNGAGHTRPEVIFDRFSSYGHIMTIRDAVGALILTVELPIISAVNRWSGKVAGSRLAPRSKSVKS